MGKIVVFIFCLIILTGCGFSTSWQGVYYPDGCLNCENEYIYSPTFDSLEECRAWAVNLKSRRNNPNDDYECGKNCKRNEYGLNICEETAE